MPTINLGKKKSSNEKKRNETEHRKLRQKAYNSTAWKKLRETYLKEHAICQECLSKGRITPATSVHHIKSPFINNEINYYLLLDYTNLMSLCHECHGNIHAKEQGHIPITELINQLDELMGITNTATKTMTDYNNTLRELGIEDDDED